ncbi:MAG TPA: 4'-phosphopantetheinyl transferase superfamily protein, partial [Aquaticitalea sp.]|nr:4'-phosphopantetheinyl transferase superfamily protein [Aquaticitalea sp.]
HKFVDYEFDYLEKDADDYINKLTVVWCIKESLYKLFATPGMLFREHFLVIPFMLHDSETVAWIDYKGQKLHFNTQFLEFEGFTCSYATT